MGVGQANTPLRHTTECETARLFYLIVDAMVLACCGLTEIGKSASWMSLLGFGGDNDENANVA